MKEKSVEVHIEEVMAQIRERIQRHQGLASTQASPAESRQAPDRAGRAIRQHLAEARRHIAPSVVITLSAQSSLGRALDRLRRPAHQLVVYYVNLLAARQAGFNKALASALEQIAEEIEALSLRIADLERENERLKEQIATLEQKGVPDRA